jgi:hypothetical protein
MVDVDRDADRAPGSLYGLGSVVPGLLARLIDHPLFDDFKHPQVSRLRVF